MIELNAKPIRNNVDDIGIWCVSIMTILSVIWTFS